MKGFVVNRLPVFCAVLLAFVTHTPGWAEEPEESGEAQPVSESAIPSAEDRANTSFEVFVPSEQISEDIPVPFPVDI